MLEVTELTDGQLNENLKRYEVDCPRSASRKEKEDLLQVAMYKYKLALEERAKAQRQIEISEKLNLDPQTNAKPSPETIAIMESEKVYAVFNNVEPPDGEGLDITFNKGTTHTFHLWDGFLHVLPKCVIDELRNPDLPTGKRPIHGRRIHPNIPDMEYDTIIGHKRRFNFEIQDTKPPKNASFGVILDSKVYEKLGIPYPVPQKATRPVG